MSLAVSCGIVSQYLLNAVTTAKMTKNDLNSYPRILDNRLAHHDLRVADNPFFVIFGCFHGVIVACLGSFANMVARN